MQPSEVRGELKDAAQRLAVLAADPAWVAGLSPAERRSVTKVLSGARDAKARSKFYDLFPPTGPFRRELYPRQMEHFRAGATHRERCIMGGNRTGKTLAGAYELTAHLTGDYPDWWDGRRFDEPGQYWAAGKQNQTVRDVIQAEMFGAVIKDANNRNMIAGGAMVPGTAIIPSTAVYRGGYPRLIDTVSIRYKDSLTEFSTLGLKAYEQGRGSFEGTARHGCWLDEECDISVYNECVIRTGTVGGLAWLTFTPLEGLTETVMQFLPDDLRPLEEEDDHEYSEE